MLLHTPEDIRNLLSTTRTIAVVGLSDKLHRASYEVSAYMQSHGYRIIPINPSLSEVLGERCYPSLTAAAQDHKLDMVDVFRNSADTPPVAQEALACHARSVWLQLGVSHPEVKAICEAAGVPLVMDRCLKIDHARWLTT